MSGAMTDRLPPPPASPAVTRPWARPLAVGAAALGACALVAVRDPNQSGSYGYCPFRVATGLDCPGCGMMRAAHALFTGDVAAVADHNVLLPVVLVIAVVAYGRWALRSIGREVRPLRVPPWTIVAAAGLVLAFGVARNVGGPFEYLASAAT